MWMRRIISLQLRQVDDTRWVEGLLQAAMELTAWTAARERGTRRVGVILQAAVAALCEGRRSSGQRRAVRPLGRLAARQWHCRFSRFITAGHSMPFDVLHVSCLLSLAREEGLGTVGSPH